LGVLINWNEMKFRMIHGNPFLHQRKIWSGCSAINLIKLGLGIVSAFYYDFMEVESLLETNCKGHSFEVLFLLKFHCELNFIEQCWGFTKHIYHHYLASSKEADLENNILVALEYVPFKNMCQYGIEFNSNVFCLANSIGTGSPLACADLWMHMRGG
jgi:hypothetical protein